MEKQTGSRADLPGGRSARKDYRGLWISAAKESADPFRKSPEDSGAAAGQAEEALPCPCPPGSVRAGGKTGHFSLEEAQKDQIIPQKTYTKWFDYDKIKQCLVIRRRRPGDYLEINREHGRKKLKAYLVDEKVPSSLRERLWMLADGSHIVWIPGYRISEGYKVTEDTKRILKVQLDGGENDG